jgi:solute carrier family 25 protein 34/35
MQLDGELQAKPALAKVAAAPVVPGGPPRNPDGRVYRNVFDALSKTWRYEGARGAQRGLGAAYAYQVMLCVRHSVQ